MSERRLSAPVIEHWARNRAILGARTFTIVIIDHLLNAYLHLDSTKLIWIVMPSRNPRPVLLAQGAIIYLLRPNLCI